MAAGDLWLCGTAPDSVYRSQDNGATWGAAISGPAGQTVIRGIAFDPDTGDLWLCGNLTRTAFTVRRTMARPGGAAISGPAGQTVISGIAFDPDTGDLWLCGSNPDSVYRSQDNGATWGAAISGPGRADSHHGNRLRPGYR